MTTIVTQLTVPHGWPIHVARAAMALAPYGHGGGRFSLDHWIDRLKT